MDGCFKMSRLDITKSFLTVNDGRKIIGEVVGIIVLAFIPVDSNLFENLFVVKPIHVHVPCLRLLWIHAGIDKTNSSGVGYLERSRRLIMSETDERWKNSDTIFSIAKSTCGFSLSS